jgi:hypothetical protein
VTGAVGTENYLVKDTKIKHVFLCIIQKFSFRPFQIQMFF